MDIQFLTLEDVLEIHKDQIDRYGGRSGIRDKNLLISALSQPPSTFEEKYLHNCLSQMASAYLFHICQNHPFIDGNKRTALMSALVFLDINHSKIDYPEKALEELTISVASGKLHKKEIAVFFDNH